MKDNEDLSWLARKADGLRGGAQLPVKQEDPTVAEQTEQLLAALKKEGIRGSLEGRTLYTKELPHGCTGCLEGEGTNLFVTGKCTRDCFFCFNTKPRTDEIVVHGVKIENPEEAPEIVERFDLSSIGISGGEPLLYPRRVLAIIAALRKMKRRLRIDLYTNGDLASDEILKSLQSAGLDSVRFNLVANNFDLDPVRRSLRYFRDTTVEIPVVPERMEELKKMVLDLDSLGVRYLNIHELFACRENEGRVGNEGYSPKEEASATLQWAPVANGDAAALELLLFSLRNARELSVYYCSCKTQEMIGKRGLERRAKSSQQTV